MIRFVIGILLSTLILFSAVFNFFVGGIYFSISFIGWSYQIHISLSPYSIFSFLIILASFMIAVFFHKKYFFLEPQNLLKKAFVLLIDFYTYFMLLIYPIFILCVALEFLSTSHLQWSFTRGPKFFTDVIIFPVSSVCAMIFIKLIIPIIYNQKNGSDVNLSVGNFLVGTIKQRK